MILDFAHYFRAIVTVEEGVAMGGVGSAVLELLSQNNVLRPTRVLGIPDQFIEQASQDRQRQISQIDCEGIVNACVELVQKAQPAVHEIGMERIARPPLRVIAGQR